MRNRSRQRPTVVAKNILMKESGQQHQNSQKEGQANIIYFLVDVHNTNYDVFLKTYWPECEQTSISDYPFTGNIGDRMAYY